MNVLIAAASFSSQLSGVQRHAFNLSRSLLAHPEVSQVNLVVAPWQQAMVKQSGLESHRKFTLHVAGMGRGSVERNLWHYRHLPALAAKLKTDVVHLSYPVPLNAAAYSCPTVVTLHDLYPFQIPSNFGFPKSIFNRAILRQCLRGATSIACVSENTRILLSVYMPPSIQQKALRIYNCVESEIECAAESPIPDYKNEPFFLCIAQHRRNKNLLFLVRAFERLLRSGQVDAATRLLIIGIPGPETRAIHRAIERAALYKNIALMGGLSDAELQWCYRNCSVVLAPSITEGFGLPVAEALLAGCRVVCSDIPAFREVGGEHCSYVRLNGDADAGYGEAAFARAIVATIPLHRDPPKPVLLPQFASARISDQYVQLYRTYIAHPASPSKAEPLSSKPGFESERQML
jgi:glycosyltransferase involved in cell wall biosynthesis